MLRERRRCCGHRLCVLVLRSLQFFSDFVRSVVLRVRLNFLLMGVDVFQVLRQIQLGGGTSGVDSAQNIQHGATFAGFSKFRSAQHTLLDSKAALSPIITRLKVGVAQVTGQLFVMIHNIIRRLVQSRIGRPRLNRTVGICRGRRPHSRRRRQAPIPQSFPDPSPVPPTDFQDSLLRSARCCQKGLRPWAEHPAISKVIFCRRLFSGRLVVERSPWIVTFPLRGERHSRIRLTRFPKLPRWVRKKQIVLRGSSSSLPVIRLTFNDFLPPFPSTR